MLDEMTEKSKQTLDPSVPFFLNVKKKKMYSLSLLFSFYYVFMNSLFACSIYKLNSPLFSKKQKRRKEICICVCRDMFANAMFVMRSNSLA